MKDEDLSEDSSFDLPFKSDNFEKLNNKIIFIPGCLYSKSTSNQLVKTCSSIFFSNGDFILQYYKRPEFLTYMMPSETQKYSEFVFNQYIQTNKISPIISSTNLKNSNLTTSSNGNLPFNKKYGLQMTKEALPLILNEHSFENSLSVSLEINLENNPSIESDLTLPQINLLTINNELSSDSLKLNLVPLTAKSSSNSLSNYQLNLNIKSSEKSLTTNYPIKYEFIKNADNSSNSLNNIQKNLKLMIYLENKPQENNISQNDLSVQVFIFNSSKSSTNFIHQYSIENISNNNLIKTSPKISLLEEFPYSTSSESKQNLILSKVSFGNSISNIYQHIYGSKTSKKFSSCTKDCLIQANSYSNSCFICKDYEVRDLRTGKCQLFCSMSQKNNFGNCLNCFFADCSENGNSSSLKYIKSENNKSFLVQPTKPIFELNSDNFKEKMKLEYSNDGKEFQEVDYDVEFLPKEENEIANKIKINHKLANDSKNDKFSNFRFYKFKQNNSKPLYFTSRDTIQNREVMFQVLSKNNNIQKYNPLDTDLQRKNVNSGLFIDLEGSDERISIDSRYKQCMDSVHNKFLWILSIILYALVILGVLLFLFNVLFIWNKTSIFQNFGFSVHIFMHMVFVFQIIVFSQFYEKIFPPSLTLFFRYLYKISIWWHGAFRNVAKSNHLNDTSFANDYFKVILPKRMDAEIVQNILINYGVILVILLVLAILAAYFYFVWRKYKFSKYDDSFEKEDICTEQAIYRFAQTFGVMLFFVTWLALSVEFSFFVSHEFINPSPNHSLFKASFAFAIILFAIHLILVLFVLAFPIVYKTAFYKQSKTPNFTKVPPQISIDPKLIQLNSDRTFPSDFLMKKMIKKKKISPLKPIKPLQNNTSQNKNQNQNNNQNQNQNIVMNPNNGGLQDTQFNPYASENKEYPTINNGTKVKSKLPAKYEYVQDGYINPYENTIHQMNYINKNVFIEDYPFLFIVQGLWNGFFGGFLMGLSSLFFTVFGIVVGGGWNSPRFAATFNTCLLFVFLVYLVISKPPIIKLYHYIMLFSYFLLFVAHLLLTVLVYQPDSMMGIGGCRMGKAIISFFVLALLPLLFGLLLAPWMDKKKCIRKDDHHYGFDFNRTNIRSYITNKLALDDNLTIITSNTNINHLDNPHSFMSKIKLQNQLKNNGTNVKSTIQVNNLKKIDYLTSDINKKISNIRDNEKLKSKIIHRKPINTNFSKSNFFNFQKISQIIIY